MDQAGKIAAIADVLDRTAEGVSLCDDPGYDWCHHEGEEPDE